MEEKYEKERETRGVGCFVAYFGQYGICFDYVGGIPPRTPDTSKKPKAPTYAGRPELIDYQGQALGREIPEWVQAVADGDKAATKKALKIDNKTMIFVISKDGQNLDFLKTWADQIDARTEVASSLKTTIAQTVQTELKAAQMDEETVTRKASMYSAQATNITLDGLQKLNSYWTRTLKTGVKKAFDFVGGIPPEPPMMMTTTSRLLITWCLALMKMFINSNLLRQWMMLMTTMSPRRSYAVY